MKNAMRVIVLSGVCALACSSTARSGGDGVGGVDAVGGSGATSGASAAGGSGGNTGAGADGGSGGTGGAGTGGASSGSGGSSACTGGTCTVQSANPTCTSCLSACCCSAWEACEGDSACQNVLSCQTQCAGDPTCMNACEKQYSSPPTYVAFNVCAFQCPTGCAPNTVCTTEECQAACANTGHSQYAFGTTGCDAQCPGPVCSPVLTVCAGVCCTCW
jgi:hypothetical protein